VAHSGKVDCPVAEVCRRMGISGGPGDAGEGSGERDGSALLESLAAYFAGPWSTKRLVISDLNTQRNSVLAPR
jgi:hypothetical protein